MGESLTILASVVLGISLAASCGLRAFLPLFVTGILARLGYVDVGDAFEWLHSTPALLALGVGVVCEMLGDKIPLVNHFLDLLQTPVRTIAGMIICAAVIVDLPVWVVAILAIIVGGGAALAIHTAKSAMRVSGNAASGGAANPLMSIAEDIVCFVSSALSILLWTVALVVSAVALVVLAVMVRALFTRDERSERES